MLLLLIAIACLGGAAFYIGELVTAPARERRNLVTRATEYGRMRIVHGRELPRFRERALAPVVECQQKIPIGRMAIENVEHSHPTAPGSGRDGRQMRHELVGEQLVRIRIG